MLLRLSAGALMLAFCLALAGCNPTSEHQSAEQDNPHFKAGREKREALDFKGAIEAFERAVEDNPRSVLAHFELGVLYEQHEADYAEALHHYNRVLKLRPSGYPSDIVRQRIPSCRQELLKADSLAVLNPAALKETERLREENRKLLYQLEILRAQMSGRMPASLSTNTTVPLPASTYTAHGSSPSAGSTNSPTRVATDTTTAGASRTAPSHAGSSARMTTLPPRADSSSHARTHSVKAGETIASIARRYGVSQSGLLSANPGVDPRRLRIGQVITVP